MTLLQSRLPGRYDNVAQARAEARSGSGVTLPAIDLLIMPANAALIGKATFYVRETAAGDPQRVLSQYIWVFGRAIEVHRKGRRRPSRSTRTVTKRKSISNSTSISSRNRTAGCWSANSQSCSNRCCLRTWIG